MNKAELIDQIAESADISKKTATDVLQGFMATITETMKNDDKVQLIGFGTFSVARRSARTCRNPQTGEAMKVPAKNVVKFKVGKQLSDTVR